MKQFYLNKTIKGYYLNKQTKTIQKAIEGAFFKRAYGPTHSSIKPKSC